MKPLISDTILRNAVVKELESDPEVGAKHISVTADDGAIARDRASRETGERRSPTRSERSCVTGGCSCTDTSKEPQTGQSAAALESR